MAVSPAAQPVSVLYAGSLVTSMEGPIAEALLRDENIRFSGEPMGSRALANLIGAGLSHPDIFISADSSLVDNLAKRNLVARSTTFGSASMVLGYSAKSPHRALFEAVAAGRMPLIDALRSPGLRIVRTDPHVDPKGLRTIEAMHLLANDETVRAILGNDDNPAQIVPEETLLVRIETGDADVGFLYSTESVARKIRAIPLPGKAALSHEITYTIAVMKQAPHPHAAQRFADYILKGNGRAILEEAGVHYRSR
ncbi:MAG: extracellular solute-binding protein [Candidatus Eremiobacteraeota bacterium]|nr:extracellular solute-binding protein [Candidatus Eremiobacteraeota bacterium]